MLVVFSYQQDAALYHTLDERLLEVLQSDTPRVNSYVEYLDTLEFDSPAQQQRTVAYLHDKYADLNIHLLVAVTPLALDFILANRDRLLPDVPIVFTSVNERRAQQAAHEPNLTGVGVTHDPAATVEIALKLHPDAVNMVIPAGSSAIERTWTAATRESLRPFERRIHITFLTDLTLAELEQRLRTLPAHTIVLFADLFYHDASGQYYLPEESLRRICLNASAPVYGLMASDMGFGIVGGSLYDMGEAGAAAGRLAKTGPGWRTRERHPAAGPQRGSPDVRRTPVAALACGRTPAAARGAMSGFASPVSGRCTAERCWWSARYSWRSRCSSGPCGISAAGCGRASGGFAPWPSATRIWPGA